MENELELQSNNIPDYKIEGYIAVFYALYCFLIFTIYFYGGHLPNGYYSIFYCLTIPFWLFLSLKMIFIYKNIIANKILLTFSIIGFVHVSLIVLIFSIPKLVLEQFNYDVFQGNMPLRTSLDSIHMHSHYYFGPITFIQAIYLLRFKGVMKYVFRFWGLLGLVYTALDFLVKPGNKYFNLIGSISCMTLAYFFFNIKEKMKNFELKNSAINDPEIIDQI